MMQSPEVARRLVTLFAFGTLLAISNSAFTADTGSGSERKDSPATVSRIANEANFTTVTLTPKAEERLRIKTVLLERKSMPLTQFFGGEVMMASPAWTTTGNGMAQSIVALLAGMTPTDRIRLAESQVDADGQVAAANVQLLAMRIAMERAERMLRDKSGSRRSVDEARAQLQLAEAEFARTKARRELLGPAALPGSTPDQLWVRVSVYAGDFQRIDTAAPARIAPLGTPKGEPGVPAGPVAAPPSANSVASSIDLFFELYNAALLFRPGERVGATVALKTAAQSLVVPWAAVIIDINGGTWVYENTAPQQFVRKRVQVSRVAGELAVLATGPTPGSKIVTDGAAELFGTEVGFAK